MTIGRADGYLPPELTKVRSIRIGDDVVIFPGAKIAATGDFVIGNGTVVGANAVLTESTGEWEIWAGNPAKMIGYRPRQPDDTLRQ